MDTDASACVFITEQNKLSVKIRVHPWLDKLNLETNIHTAEEGGFWAEVPAMPGCFTQAETYEELVLNLREAVTVWLS